MNRSRTTRHPHSPRSGRLPGSLLLPLLLILTYSVQAQSGRRPPQPPQRTATAEAVNTSANEKSAKTDSKPAAEELKHKVILVVARELTKKHLISEDTIYTSFIKRLNEFTNVTGTSIGDLRRDQAIKRAQRENDSFVVLLQFEIDNFQDGRIVLNSPDLEVKYFVFAPRTGRQQLKGKLYYQAIGGAHGRKDNWPNGPPIKITAEAAGSEVAERLYAWLAATVGMKRNN